METAKPTIVDYQGYPVFQVPLNEEGTSNFRFGVRKALAIIKHIDALKQFVEDNPLEEEEANK